MWHCAVVTDYLMFVSQQREQLIIYKMKVVLIAILAAIAFSLNEAVPGKKTLVSWRRWTIRPATPFSSLISSVIVAMREAN